MKFLMIPIALLALATPASAITWKEFWEPFKTEEHHHHHYPRRVREVCYHNVPVKVYRNGRLVDHYYETVREPCWKKYHDSRDHHH
jgi:deoxycytidine triphosphate deaminase